MDLRTAKELLHLQRWLALAARIVEAGKEAYDRDEIAQEAGDSVMIKIGEAAKTLAARGVQAPSPVNWSDAARNREKIAHHYSTIDCEVTWTTLSASLPEWQRALQPLFAEAERLLRDIPSGPTRT